MKDRIPTYPGRVRLIPVDGQTDVFDLERADEPTEPGTPLSKANLLSDATAALYGLGENATPDSAFANVPGIARKVSNKGWKLLQSYTAAGAFTWTASDLFNGQDYKIGALIIGAGGSGASAAHTNQTRASGGASGYSASFETIVTPGQEILGVVGAGGVGTPSTNTSHAGAPGGASSFNGVTVNGGGGGDRSIVNSTNVNGAVGGQSSSILGSSGTPFDSSINLFGGAIIKTNYSTGESTCMPTNCINPFEHKQILGAGGGAYGYTPLAQPGGKDPITGLGGGNGAASNTGSISADSGDAPGCGGGGAACYGSSSYTATPGNGADGAVFIYVQGAND